MAIPSLKMNTGAKIPQVGLGLWIVLPGFVAKKAVRSALDADYRHFDTAQAYHNEQHLGAALKESGIDRGEVFITTKIRTTNLGSDDIIPSFEKSLDKLQTDYVDLLLIHFPVTETRKAAWQKLEEIHKSGRAKAIGVSNYMVSHLEELLKECTVKPAVNQVELHVFLQMTELVDYCKKKGIIVEAYSPLAHGHGMDDPVLQKIAKKHGKTTAQIMLRWCLEIGTVPLPKSTHKDRIKENIDIFDFKLDIGDMAELKKLDRGFRTCWDPTNVP
ncbi:aldo/keto reductase [Candidatus Saccharibacteria bacterium]|nr:aldo/keto reductase [Candidatus Saccharibacteria bacterium]